jgi:hypothetical protein
MKRAFAISLILTTAAIILCTYFSLYEIEHHALKIYIIILIVLLAASIFIFCRLYLRYMNRPVDKSDLPDKKGSR